MKKCKYCNEDIQEDAIVCKHCGNDLIPRKSPRPLKKRGPGRIALIGLGILIFSCIAIAIGEGMRHNMTMSQNMAFSFFFGFSAWAGIILLIVALVRTIRRRKKTRR